MPEVADRAEFAPRVSLVLSVLVTIVGITVLVGWFYNVTALKSIVPGLVTMKANTALCLMLSGAGLALLSINAIGNLRGVVTIALCLAILELALAILSLSEYFLNIDIDIDLGLDQWLVRDASAPIGTSTPGRMSPTTAFCLVLSGSAIFLGALPALRLRLDAIRALGLTLIVICGLALVGYISELTIHTRTWNYTGMAIHTAAALVMFGVGLLFFASREGVRDWSLGRTVLIGFAAAVVVMLTAAGVAYNATNRLVDASAWVSHTHEILRSLEEVSVAMADLESGQRGYIITGDEGLLARRHQSKIDLHDSIEYIRSLVVDNVRQQERLAHLEPLIGGRTEFGEQTIATRRQEGFSAAQAMLATGVGIKLTDSINALIKEMHGEEIQLLGKRMDVSKSAGTKTFLLLPLGMFLCLTLLVLGLFFLNAGVHDRAKVEQALRESEELFSKAFKFSPDGVVIVRVSDRAVIRANEAICSIWGSTPEDVIGKPAQQFANWNDENERLEFMRMLQEKGEYLNLEVGRRLSDGRDHVFDVCSRMILLNEEPCTLSVMRDVTERKRLDEAQLLLVSIVNSSDDAIIGKTLHGTITSWNPGAEKIFGYSAAEVIGKPLLLLFPPERINEERQILSRLRCGESVQHFETVRVRKDGKLIDISVTLSPMFDYSGKIIGASKIARDITERKQAQKALLASEERYRTTLDSLSEGCQLIGFDWRYLYLNDVAAIHNRRENSELLGKTMMEVWPGIEASQAFGLLQRSMQERIALHDEIEFIFPDEASGWFDLRVHPVSEGIFVLSIDISERKHAEMALRELNESLELRVAARTEELQAALIRAEGADRFKSAFLATMSHELRTPLNSILGFTGLILQGLPGPLNPEQAKQLGMVMGSARHLLDLINDVLDISKIEAGQMEVTFEAFDLQTTIDQVRELITPMAHQKGLALNVVAPSVLPPMVSDRRRVVQILINLLNNAVKFTERGTVSVTVELVVDPKIVARASVCVHVADTGVGIKPEDLSVLFKPFRQIDSSLSRQHEGTGLGLAICSRLAALLGGDVRVQSKWGSGSVFTVTLPLEPRT